MSSSILARIASAFCPPTRRRAVFWPSLKKRRVGRLRTPFSVQKSFSSSTLYLPTIARPSYYLASSSITGAIAMQGPHHVAQKSITTGCPVAIVSLTLASVNVNAIMKKNCMLGGLSGHERASPYFIIYVEVFESLYEVFGKTCSDCRRECERAADVGRVNHH